jgi:hypothetical protein
VSSNIGVDSIYSINYVIQWRLCQAAGFSTFLLHGSLYTYLSIIIPKFMPLPLAYTQNGDENAGRDIKIDDSQ